MANKVHCLLILYFVLIFGVFFYLTAEPKGDHTAHTQQLSEVQAVMAVLRKQQADQVVTHPLPFTGDRPPRAQYRHPEHGGGHGQVLPGSFHAGAGEPPPPRVCLIPSMVQGVCYALKRLGGRWYKDSQVCYDMVRYGGMIRYGGMEWHIYLQLPGRGWRQVHLPGRLQQPGLPRLLFRD